MSGHLKFQIICRNPHLSQIKQEYPLSYMIADASCHSLAKRIPKDEIGLMALQISVAISKLYNNKNKSILITEIIGKAASQYLVYLVEKWFDSSFKTISAYDINHLKTLDLTQHDCILTTEPFPDYVKFSALMISPLLLEDDYIKTGHFLGNLALAFKQSKMSHLDVQDTLSGN